jgi:hypothetical protein
MEPNLEHRIRERAYDIWRANGYVEGQSDQHWLTAEREVLAALTTKATFPKPSEARKPRARATTPKTKPQLRASAG